MTIQKEVGDRGEQLAQAYLRSLGYVVLDTNWRYKRAEIDLIAMDGETLVFIEVKTRSYDYYGSPDAFVDTHKEELMTGAAHVYMERIDHNWEVRFDVISVLLEKGKPPQMEHIKSAFFHGL